MTKEQIRKEQARIREEVRDQELAITEHEVVIKTYEATIKGREVDIAKVRNKIAVLMREYEAFNLETPTKKAKAKNAK